MDTNGIDTNKTSSKLPAGAVSPSAGTSTNQTPVATGSADSVRNAPVSPATGTNEISPQQASTLAAGAAVDSSANTVMDSK